MSTPDPGEVTQLLHRWSGGDRHALDELMPLVYQELRQLAASHIAREPSGHTLQPTALVHEAYLRLVRQNSVSFESRLKFYGAAAQMMRRVLCDNARNRKAQKRGGGAPHETLDIERAAMPAVTTGQDADVVDLDKLDVAMEELEKLDERKVRIVELRFFAGLSIAEAAAALSLSPATVKREWTVARAWLASRLRAA